MKEISYHTLCLSCLLYAVSNTCNHQYNSTFPLYTDIFARNQQVIVTLHLYSAHFYVSVQKTHLTLSSFAARVVDAHVA